MNFYLDSSALVKLYIDEVGLDRIKEIIFSEKNNIFISKIAGAEVAAAFSRRNRMKDIAEEDYDEVLSDFLSDFSGLFAKSEVTDSIISLAIKKKKRRALRGYDSVQLASAIMLNAEINVISADVDLNGMAKAEGLVVEDLIAG
ncbi:MAG: type II toxin-antitoxin system VapC family toxin [Planctomycetes bacterium]|nr:type II toxin-antitoxin system VapC family toxin [Planctomycetota bacterium]